MISVICSWFNKLDYYEFSVLGLLWWSLNYFENATSLFCLVWIAICIITVLLCWFCYIFGNLMQYRMLVLVFIILYSLIWHAFTNQAYTHVSLLCLISGETLMLIWSIPYEYIIVCIKVHYGLVLIFTILCISHMKKTIPTCATCFTNHLVSNSDIARHHKLFPHLILLQLDHQPHSLLFFNKESCLMRNLSFLYISFCDFDRRLLGFLNFWHLLKIVDNLIDDYWSSDSCDLPCKTFVPWKLVSRSLILIYLLENFARNLLGILMRLVGLKSWPV